jgi:hypothetical protein
MRVICIQIIGEGNDALVIISIGSVYEVVDVVSDEEGLWYELSHQLNVLYPAQDFVPLSDLDETIIHADKIKEDSYA